MNFQAFSLYWDNVNPEMVYKQAQVCHRFGLAINQHRINGLDHGQWMTWALEHYSNADVLLFLDIDCVPISVKWGYAFNGTLTGAEGCANHLDPTASYAAPWFLFVPRAQWNALGRPSCGATPYGDVAQALTKRWLGHKKPVKMIPPTHVETPLWDLPGRPKAYGIGTTYGEFCYHQFQSRGGGSAPFFAKCKSLLATGEAL